MQVRHKGDHLPVLANLALDGLETLLKQHLGVTRAKKLKVNVVRYADDFVITEPPGGTGNEVKPWVEQFLVRGDCGCHPRKRESPTSTKASTSLDGISGNTTERY
jgi:hypothetical protein